MISKLIFLTFLLTTNFSYAQEKDTGEKALERLKARLEKSSKPLRDKQMARYPYRYEASKDLNSIKMDSIGKSADQGNAESQYQLGYEYYYGRGFPNDYNKAVFWLKKSSELGNSKAQNMLADCYYNAKGVSKDVGEALYWHTKAADQGNSLSQKCLGLIYYIGSGGSIDYEKAFYWLTKSAEQGNADAQRYIAYFYSFGGGVARDMNKAIDWYTKSAEQGFSIAQHQLGNLYYMGEGLQQDYEKAIYWYKKAASNGHRDSQYNLAICYYYGKGVPQDKELGLSLAKLARQMKASNDQIYNTIEKWEAANRKNKEWTNGDKVVGVFLALVALNAITSSSKNATTQSNLSQEEQNYKDLQDSNKGFEKMMEAKKKQIDYINNLTPLIGINM